MSDTAPLFSGEVVEVLRSQTILDLQEELERGNRQQYRIFITLGDDLQSDDENNGRILAEGFLDEAEVIDRDDLPSFYSKILPPPDDEFFWTDRPYKAVKLRNVDPCVGDDHIFDDLIFAVKMGDGVRVKIAESAEGDIFHPRDCLVRFVGDVDLDDADRVKVEVNGCELAFKNVVLKYCFADNPDKDDFPEGQSWRERQAMIDEAPAGGIKAVFECAVFEWKSLPTSLGGVVEF